MADTVLISDVRLGGLQASPDRDRHEAFVILTTDISTMCVLCTAATTPSGGRGAVMRTLVSDALRQIRQMPEFRNGARDITPSPALAHTTQPATVTGSGPDCHQFA